MASVAASAKKGFLNPPRPYRIMEKTQGIELSSISEELKESLLLYLTDLGEMFDSMTYQCLQSNPLFGQCETDGDDDGNGGGNQPNPPAVDGDGNPPQPPDIPRTPPSKYSCEFYY